MESADEKWTAGPWQMKKHGQRYRIVEATQGLTVAHVPIDERMTTQRADANLMAAAPDLATAALEALDFISSHFQHLTTGAWENRDAQEVADQLTCALKRARGKA